MGWVHQTNTKGVSVQRAAIRTGSTPGWALQVGLMRASGGSLRAYSTTRSLNAASYTRRMALLLLQAETASSEDDGRARLAMPATVVARAGASEDGIRRSVDDALIEKCSRSIVVP